ncbi:MAG: PASTA domain-containing protein [Flavobacteriales bacterium]|nr:PASTA domain-containing protein [Flavobacteriales bacterium]
MRLLRFIISRTFWVQLGLVAVLAVVGFVALNVFLRAFTRHSERIAVPSVVGVHMNEAEMALEAAGLQPVVMDSLYSAKGQPGSVVEQDPAAGVEVKGTRNVYLTVYRSTPPSERLEVEEGMDAGVARILLDVKGFPFRERYEPSTELSGLVMRIEDSKGNLKMPDDRLRKGAPLVLVIGQASSQQVALPELVGLTRREGMVALKRSGLSMGFSRWSFTPGSGQDSSQALISSQVPAYTPGRQVNEGTAIDLTFEQPVTETEVP